MQTKDEQDVFLQSLMELEPVERKRQRPDFDKTKPKAFMLPPMVTEQWYVNKHFYPSLGLLQNSAID
jgi:hypothetical protein